MFRPCIDLHEGRVKQIVGGTLSADPRVLRTNFVSERPSGWFAELFKRDGLGGGHLSAAGAFDFEPTSAKRRWRDFSIYQELVLFASPPP